MDDLEISIKKFLYKSSHRGSKEMDLIIGNFAKKFIDLFDKNELHLFSQILDSDDDDLYQWESLLETHAEKTILPLQGVPDTLHIYTPRFAHPPEGLWLTSCIVILTL